MKMRTSENGNALVMVLIIVGLFGLLSAVVLGLGKSGSPAQGQRAVEMGINEMMRYAASLENTVYTMIMIDNVADTAISFEHADDSPSTLHQNANCTNNICKVFDIVGGGITWRQPPEAVAADTADNYYIISGASSIYGHGTDGADAADAELFLTASITEDACVAAGDILNVPFSDATGPEDDFLNPAFTGAYSSTSGKVIDHADLQGMKAFCFKNTTDSKYYFVYVLHSR